MELDHPQGKIPEILINYGSELNTPVDSVEAIWRPLIGRHVQEKNPSNFMKISRPPKKKEFIPGELGDNIIFPLSNISY